METKRIGRNFNLETASGVYCITVPYVLNRNVLESVHYIGETIQPLTRRSAEQKYGIIHNKRGPAYLRGQVRVGKKMGIIYQFTSKYRFAPLELYEYEIRHVLGKQAFKILLRKRERFWYFMHIAYYYVSNMTMGIGCLQNGVIPGTRIKGVLTDIIGEAFKYFQSEEFQEMLTFDKYSWCAFDEWKGAESKSRNVCTPKCVEFSSKIYLKFMIKYSEERSNG